MAEWSYQREKSVGGLYRLDRSTVYCTQTSMDWKIRAHVISADDGEKESCWRRGCIEVPLRSRRVESAGQLHIGLADM